jgi:hypothetical protein
MDEIILAKKAYNAALDTDDIALQAYSLFVFGFTLYFAKEYSQALSKLHKALLLAQKQSDITLQARCLSYITIVYRQINDQDNAQKYASLAFSISVDAGMDDYVAIAEANQAWLKCKQKKPDEALTLIRNCNDKWQALEETFPFPLQWLSLLVEVYLLFEQVENQVSRGDQIKRLFTICKVLLDEKQQQLPEQIASNLSLFLQQCENRNTLEVFKNNSLISSLKYAEKLGYL